LSNDVSIGLIELVGDLGDKLIDGQITVTVFKNGRGGLV
jgi:hypothetical protein